MKVAIVSQYYPPEPVRIPSEIAAALTDRGHSVRVVTGFPNYPTGRLAPGFRQRWRHVETDDKVLVRRVPLFVNHSRNPLARALNYTSFALSSRSTRRFVDWADVVYVYATQMTAASAPMAWTRRGGPPVVLHVVDLWPESVTGSSLVQGGALKHAIDRMLVPWLRRMYGRAAAVISIGPGMAGLLVERGAAPDRIETVYNWASEDNVTPRSEPEPHEGLRLMYAGNIGDMQDLETVVRAFARLDDLPGRRLTLVGSGVAESRIRALVRQSGLDDVVEFAGRMERSEMSALYAESDFQLVTLKPLPIFEATIPSKLQASLAHGVPVITNVAGDVTRLVEDWNVGVTCAPGDPEALADAIRRAHAIGHRERVQMGRRARNLYTSTMSKEQAMTAIERTLERAAEGARGKARR